MSNLQRTETLSQIKFIESIIDNVSSEKFNVLMVRLVELKKAVA